MNECVVEPIVRSHVRLSQPYCDYFECVATPTVTNGEAVMCRGHEPDAYRTPPWSPWRPIVEVAAGPAPGVWPHWVAYF